MDNRFRITYLLSCSEDERPTDRAREIAYEQTVELPVESVPPEIAKLVVGRVESLEPAGGGRFKAAISYAQAAIGEDFPQFLNLLFGNISLQRGILVIGIDWPPEWLGRFEGPRFGIDGIRRLCRVGSRRPLLCAALKPMGLSAAAHARLASGFAEAGVDVIKEDHGLADQHPAPFAERIRICSEAVAEANGRTGGGSLYVPNLNSPADLLDERLELARDAGVRCILLSPLLIGPDCMRRVAEQSGLAVLAHPALSGAYFQEGHGILPELLLGRIFRMLGADGVIYPNAGGRFPFSEESCLAINAALREKLGSMRPSFPMPGGGIDAGRLPAWAERYGADTIFLIGGSLYASKDPAAAAAELLGMLKTEFP